MIVINNHSDYSLITIVTSKRRTRTDKPPSTWRLPGAEWGVAFLFLLFCSLFLRGEYACMLGGGVVVLGSGLCFFFWIHFGSKKTEFLDKSSIFIDILLVIFEPKWSPTRVYFLFCFFGERGEYLVLLVSLSINWYICILVLKKTKWVLWVSPFCVPSHFRNSSDRSHPYSGPIWRRHPWWGEEVVCIFGSFLRGLLLIKG